MKKTLATIALVASLLGCKEGHRHEPHEESSQAAEPPHPDEVSLSAEAATGVRLDKVRSLVLQPRLTAPASPFRLASALHWWRRQYPVTACG